MKAQTVSEAIRAAVKGGARTAREILNVIGAEGYSRTDWSREIAREAQAGRLMIEWDEEGNTIYSIA